MTTDTRWRPTITGYVSVWVAAAILVVAASATLSVSLGADPPATWLLGFCIVFIILADATEIRLDRGSTSVYQTLLELGVVTTLLVLPAGFVPLAVASAVLVHHGWLRRRPLLKVGFNIGQHAVGAGVAALTLLPFHRPGDPVGGRAIAGVLIAMTAYGIVNALAIGGLFAQLAGTPLRGNLRAQMTTAASTLLGASVVGILVVGVWQANPALTPLLVSPIAALHLAYHATARTETLLSEVRVERDRLDLVLAGASEGIVLLDAAGAIKVWNPAMAAITGHPADEVAGRQASAFLSGTDAEGTLVDPIMPLVTGRSDTFELNIPTAGDPAAVRMTHTLVTDDDGAPNGDVILVRDLSRERAAKSLKEDFVARVSHELRTPLSPIRGYAQTLLRGGDRIPPKLRQEALETIVERTEHLERLIEDLLLVSRVENSGDAPSEIASEAVDAHGLAERTVGWVRREHPDRTITVTGTGDHVAWCDPLRTGQIITNLLTNACKYSRPGTPIEVLVRGEDDVVALDVRDRGDGIPADQLETVFERFQRLDDPLHMTTGGIGLGLYIARRLAHLMDGSLSLVSQRGEGSTFTLTLPAAGAAVARHPAQLLGN